MKKKFSLLYVIGLFCAVSMMTTSCSNNDNDGPGIPDGVNATYSASGSDNVLALTYSSLPLPGKSATFNTTDGQTATITLDNVIPGELKTSFDKVPLTLNNAGTVYTFKTTNTQGDRAVAFEGSVEKGKMTLSLDVTMTNALVGKWNMVPFVLDDFFDIVSTPVSMAWEVAPTLEDPETNEKITTMAENIGSLGNSMGGMLLSACLRSVTFGKDGNITAEYASLDGYDILQDIIFATEVPVRDESDWVSSPANLCTYYVKGDKVYITPNIETIMALISGNAAAKMKSDAGLGGMEGLDPALIAVIMGWLQTGIPMNIVTENGVTTLSLDKTTLSPFFPMIPGLLGSVVPEDMMGLLQMVGIHVDLLPDAFACTTKFDVGLNMTKAAN